MLLDGLFVNYTRLYTRNSHQHMASRSAGRIDYNNEEVLFAQLSGDQSRRGISYVDCQSPMGVNDTVLESAGMSLPHPFMTCQRGTEHRLPQELEQRKDANLLA
eukprot:766211-Hanusia_phi.AAC.2